MLSLKTLVILVATIAVWGTMPVLPAHADDMMKNDSAVPASSNDTMMKMDMSGAGHANAMVMSGNHPVPSSVIQPPNPTNATTGTSGTASSPTAGSVPVSPSVTSMDH